MWLFVCGLFSGSGSGSDCTAWNGKINDIAMSVKGCEWNSAGRNLGHRSGIYWRDLGETRKALRLAGPSAVT